jgi:hypothetical protein
MPRGGKRKGAGRKRNSEPSVPIRVPLSKKEEVKRWLNSNAKSENSLKVRKINLSKSLEILEKALTLKANAGGKIKSEIRHAIQLIKEI